MMVLPLAAEQIHPQTSQGAETVERFAGGHPHAMNSFAASSKAS